MTRLAAIVWIFSALPLAAAVAPDLLRFSNGDQLHGTFEGIATGGEIRWRREDVAESVGYKTDLVRHVVLNGGRPHAPLDSLSNVALVNGDRIPGNITGMDESSVTLETDFAGTLRIPRNEISMLAPSPLGGRLRYHGPFVEDEWRQFHPSFPDGIPTPKPVDKSGKSMKSDVSAPQSWKFSGAAWYWADDGYGTALLRDDAMPDRAILRFDVAWKNRLSVAIGFNADFAKTKPQKEEDGEDPQPGRMFGPGDSSALPVIFGNSYVIQMFSTNLMLFRTAVDAAGKPTVDRVQINGNGVRFGDSGKATLEIRSNKLTGAIALFIDGEFVVQWNEGMAPDGADGFAGKGSGFGFVVRSDNSPVRISDIFVAEWNGMPDSARSLQTDDQDIVLLANGTDRFSGKVGAYADGKILMEGKYGRFSFALDEIAEIRFARDGLADVADPPEDNLVVRFSPLGQISGRPLAGDGSSIRLATPFCGEIGVKLESAVMLDFRQTSNFIDAWDEEF